MSKRFYRMLELGDAHDYSEREYHCYKLTPDEARAVYEALREYFEG